MSACTDEDTATRGEFPVHISCNVPDYNGYKTIYLNNNTTAPIYVQDTGYKFESIHDLKADTMIYSAQDATSKSNYYGIQVNEERWIEVRYTVVTEE